MLRLELIQRPPSTCAAVFRSVEANSIAMRTGLVDGAELLLQPSLEIFRNSML